MAHANLPRTFLSSLLLIGLAGCSNLPSPPWVKKSTTAGPSDTTTRGTGTVTVGGVATEYTVDAPNSHFYLLVKKGSGSQCSFFHHHAIAALGIIFDFNLDKSNPAGSHFNLTTSPAGLDLDADEWRNAFPETAGTSFSSGDRSDSRANMNEQLDSANFPTLTFNAHNLSTLDGSGTAPVDITIKGGNSTTTINATATWAGNQLTITGTGTFDGHNHNMPVGTFKDCIDPTMTMDLKLTVIPGHSGTQTLPDAGPAFTQQTFPDTLTCAPVGWQSVQRPLAIRCGTCHSNPTTQGATIPLVTYDDYRINTPLHPNGPIYEDVTGRLAATDGRRMPPLTATQVPQAEIDLINQWVAGGGALHECDSDGGVKVLPDAGAVVAVDAGPPPACGAIGYDVDIAPLMNQHCVSCHNPAGGSTPLNSYLAGFAATTVAAYRPMNLWQASAARITDHTMWPNAPTNATTDALATTFNAWVAGNLPQGKCDADGGIVTPPDAGSQGPVDSGPPPNCGPVGYADVAGMLANYCTSCHKATGSRPGSPLDSYQAGFATAPVPYQTMNLWQAAKVRIDNGSMPAGVTVPAAQVTTFDSWVNGNMPLNNCAGNPDAGIISNTPTCTSNSFATSNRGNSNMRPGGSCIDCHNVNGGPDVPLVIAGTVMGLLHDQNDCRSPVAAGITGVKIHVVPAAGAAFDIPVLAGNNGNFMYDVAPVAEPYHVSLVYTQNGAVVTRPMSAAPSQVPGVVNGGDCNSCHTVAGLNGAPGRITPFP